MHNIPDDPNGRVIEILSQLGSDLSKEHRVDFYFYFPSILSTILVAFLLAKIGFEVDIKPSAGKRADWLCLAMFNLIPEHEAILQLHERFDMIVEMLGGRYDGWETMVMN